MNEFELPDDLLADVMGMAEREVCSSDKVADCLNRFRANVQQLNNTLRAIDVAINAAQEWRFDGAPPEEVREHFAELCERCKTVIELIEDVVAQALSDGAPNVARFFTESAARVSNAHLALQRAIDEPYRFDGQAFMGIQ